MGKYQAYPEYKDSGVEWIGEIPAHWNLTKIRYITECLDGKRVPLNATERGDMQGDIPYWGANSIVDHVNDWLFDEELVLIGEDGAPFFDRTKSVAFNVLGKVWPNNHVHVLRPIVSKINPKYLTYSLNNVDYHLYITGSTRDKLNQSDLNAIIIRYCPTQEQESIANFLDHETAKIDTLIKKQQQLIQLLKEKRQAVISHAVTKGLNLNAPMKDSGVEWLGEVPEGWATGRLTYQVELLVDGTHHSPESYPEGDFLYVTAKNIKEHGFDFSNISYISKSAHQEIYSRCGVKKGDVLYIKDGATAGIAMVNNLDEEFSLLSSVALIRPRKNIFRPEFLKHHLNASVFKNEMLNRLSGGAMTRFTIDGISRFNLFIPPLEEQDKIVELIENMSARMDILINRAEQAIQLMQERRTALISAAVTGKIDVRDWQTPQN